MRRLGKPILALLVINMILIIMFKFVGTTRQDPLMPLFTNPDGTPCQMPCLLGIQPGKTTLKEAIALVKLHPLTSSLRLFVGDFSSIPSHFSYEHSSVLFVGKAEQVVVLQIFENPYNEYRYPSMIDDLVYAVRLSSVLNNSTVELPSISPALARMWSKTSFKQMVASLGPPTSISLPSVQSQYTLEGDTYMEAFYDNDLLVITHSSDKGFPDLNRNFFGSLCVYSVAEPGYRLVAGYQTRVGVALPWLGFASLEKYKTWVQAAIR